MSRSIMNTPSFEGNAIENRECFEINDDQLTERYILE